MSEIQKYAFLKHLQNRGWRISYDSLIWGNPEQKGAFWKTYDIEFSINAWEKQEYEKILLDLVKELVWWSYIQDVLWIKNAKIYTQDVVIETEWVIFLQSHEKALGRKSLGFIWRSNEDCREFWHDMKDKKSMFDFFRWIFVFFKK